MVTGETPNPDILVACPRCQELVVTVEMLLPATVYWRCVRCGHIFVQRRHRSEEPPRDGNV
jgi:uncharacterized C2H2 Zn-finger protein